MRFEARLRKLEEKLGSRQKRQITMETVEFTEEQVEEYKRVCRCFCDYFPDVKRHGWEVSRDCTLQEEGWNWIFNFGSCFFYLLQRPEDLEKARRVPELKPIVEFYEDFQRKRQERSGPMT